MDEHAKGRSISLNLYQSEKLVELFGIYIRTILIAGSLSPGSKHSFPLMRLNLLFAENSRGIDIDIVLPAYGLLFLGKAVPGVPFIVQP